LGRFFPFSFFFFFLLFFPSSWDLRCRWRRLPPPPFPPSFPFSSFLPPFKILSSLRQSVFSLPSFSFLPGNEGGRRGISFLLPFFSLSLFFLFSTGGRRGFSSSLSSFPCTAGKNEIQGRPPSFFFCFFSLTSSSFDA